MKALYFWWTLYEFLPNWPRCHIFASVAGNLGTNWEVSALMSYLPNLSPLRSDVSLDSKMLSCTKTHTHKPGYDEKIVVKNYKKMHLRFLIHLFWFPHPYLMICYVNLGFGIHMKRIKMLVAWWLTLFLWSTFRPQRNSQWKKYWSWRRLKVFFRFLMWYHVHVAWELLAILDLMRGKRVFPCWSAVFPGSFCSLKWVTKVLHQKATCDCFGCMFVCKYSPTSVGTAWWNWK